MSNKPFKPLDLDQIKALLNVVNDDISVIEEEIKKGKESQSQIPNENTADHVDTVVTKVTKKNVIDASSKTFFEAIQGINGEKSTEAFV